VESIYSSTNNTPIRGFCATVFSRFFRFKTLFGLGLGGWKSRSNGRANQRHCKPLQGNGSATVTAHVRCRLQPSPATGSATS
jgi:hypothetical protein